MTQLCQHQGELGDVGAKVLLVTFGDPLFAQVWQREVCPPFPLLLDPHRKVYRSYGLRRSLIRSWNITTLRHYVRLIRTGRNWRGIHGDSTQLGGDFIVDADGIVRFAHRSRDPTDRPPVADLIARLQRIARERDAYEV